MCRNNVIHFQKQLVSSRAVDPEPKNFEWWSQSLKFESPFNRQFVEQANCTNKTMVFSFIGPNCSGAGAKKFWIPGAGTGTTALVPLTTTANLAPGFLSASFLKQVANWSASVV